MRHEEVVPPPPHRLEQGHITEVETERGGRELRIAHQLPLDRYLSHGHITPRQHRAGRRYETLFVMSKHLHHHVQVRYSEFEPVHGSDFEARYLISVEYLEATKAIRDVLPRHFVNRVCLEWGKAGRANMSYLRDGLNDLADHFAELDKQRRK